MFASRRIFFSYKYYRVLDCRRKLTLTTTLCHNLTLKGVYPTLATPFNKDDTIAFDKLKKNVEALNKTDLRGYLIHDSNGESCFLNLEEKIEIVKKVVHVAGKDKIILVGSGCESTIETIQLTNCMASIGADAAVVVNPSFLKGPMSEPEVIKAFYTSVANASFIPIILYDVPDYTDVEIPTELIAELAEHPNIIGIKVSGLRNSRKIGEIISQTKDNFQVLPGNASVFLNSLQSGAVGLICPLANVLPKETSQLQELFDEGQEKEAIELQSRLIGPDEVLAKKLTIARMKAIMTHLGYEGGLMRQPLLPLKDMEVEHVKSVFKKSGFIPCTS